MKLGASGSGEVRDRKVEPAMTAEEWAVFGDVRGVPWSDYWNQDGYGPDQPSYRGVAALALYGQPFGFTWEDVRRIRQTAHLDDCMDYERADLLNLADRIAALLPPREET